MALINDIIRFVSFPHLEKRASSPHCNDMKLSQQLHLAHFDAFQGKVMSQTKSSFCVTAFYSTTEFHHSQYAAIGWNLYQSINSKITKYFPFLHSRKSKLCHRKKIHFFPSETIFRNCLVIKASQKRTKNCYQGSTIVQGLSPGVRVPLFLSAAASELLCKRT